MPARMTPETCVLPPARMLMTVPMVAPAPGSPPRNPAIMLPMPWPTSSRLALCCVRVIESAMSEVSRLSIDPSIAMVSAGVTARARMSGDRSGSCGVGKPVGTMPITGTSVSHSTPIIVPTPSATSVGGRMRRSRAGHRMPTASVTAAMAKALVLKLAMPSPQPLMAAMGPPSATGIPMKGSVCSRMMMMPMPDMKPEITEYGVNAMNRPMPTTPSSTWKRPAMMTMVNAAARLSAWRVTTTAIATAMGPVGPEIWERVPPNTAAKNPTAIAP